MRRLAVAVVSVVLFVGVGASAAFAGEVTGSGKPTAAPTHANSICAFSGLEDGAEGGPAGPGNTQNWGSIPKEVRDFLRTIGEYPGESCNGSKNPLKG